MASLVAGTPGSTSEIDFPFAIYNAFAFTSGGYVADSASEAHLLASGSGVPDSELHFTGTDLDKDTGTITGLEYTYDNKLNFIAAGLDLNVGAVKAAITGVASRQPFVDLLSGIDWNIDLTAAKGSSKVYTTGGDDTVKFGTGNDQFTADGGNDTVNMGAGDDSVFAFSQFFRADHGITHINGGAGYDSINFYAGSPDDLTLPTHGLTIDLSKPVVKIFGYQIEWKNFESVGGSPLPDTFIGSSGNDVYAAAGGGDIITGGGGADKLFGSYGEDVFVYKKVSDSQGTNIDTIFNYEHNVDYFDLSALHPATKNDQFKFVGEGDLTTVGDLHYYAHNERGTAHDYTMIEALVDDKPGVDFRIKLSGVYDLGTGDFIL
jgi:serralysin